MPSIWAIFLFWNSSAVNNTRPARCSNLTLVHLKRVSFINGSLLVGQDNFNGNSHPSSPA